MANTTRLLVALALASAVALGWRGIADAATCFTCHAPVGSTTDIRPVESTYRNISTGSIVGSHAKHIPAPTTDANACAPCHIHAASYTTKHRDGFIQVSSVRYSKSASFPQSGNPTLGTCSAASCHDNGKGVVVATPVWGTTVPACTACHALIPTDATHTKHISGTGFANKAVCADCHNGYVQGTTAHAVNHRDGNIDVYKTTAGDLGYPIDKAKGTAAASCTTAYCHSSGQGTSANVATPVYATITWGATGLTCTSCHGATQASLTTGSHPLHLAADSNCGNCHTGATASAYTSATHINGSIDVGSGTYTAAGVAGNGYGTCSTATCHGSGTTPQWGSNTSNATCTKCHGKPTVLANYSTSNAWQAAPGYAQVAGSGTYTANVSDTAPYGAHDAHVRAVNQYTTRRTLCSDCHGTLPTSGTHANGLTMSFSDLAKNIGTSGGNATTGPATRGTLTPTYSGGTCSAVYCHGGVMAGTDTTPEWRYTGTSYLTPYAKNATNCGKCHAALPVVAAKDHSTMTFATQNCSGCHGHEGNGPKHIDGILQASGACDSCHGYQAGSWAGATTINLEGKGAHEAHITWLTTKRFTQSLNPATDTYAASTTAWTNVCGICHGSTASNHQNNTVNIILGTTYQFGLVAPAYKGTPGVSSATVGSEKTCSNISCHYFTTPLWSSY